MEQNALLKFLNEISDNGVGFVHNKGFNFFNTMLILNVLTAEYSIKNYLPIVGM